MLIKNRPLQLNSKPLTPIRKQVNNTLESPISFSGNDNDCKKNLLATATLYKILKTLEKISPRKYLMSGELETLKTLKEQGAVFIFAPKHYDKYDNWVMMKLFSELSKNHKDFHNFIPHLLHKERNSKFFAISDNLLGMINIKGNGKVALIKALELLSNHKNIMIYPEGECGLKYYGEEIRPEKQDISEIKPGLAHLALRYIENNKNSAKNVYIVPVGISGNSSDDGKTTTLHVHQPTNLAKLNSSLLEGKTDYKEKIKILNDYLILELTNAQKNAFLGYLQNKNL